MQLNSTRLTFLTRTTFLRHLAVLFLFTAICWLSYSNVLYNGQFLFDDYDYILNNTTLLSIDNFRNITDPRYIGYLSFFLNVRQYGLNPYYFHWVNILIHTLNAFLIYQLISLFIRIARQEDDSLPSWWETALPLLTALLFLCHPLATQSVSYLTQRFTSLSAFFYLLAVVLYLAARVRFEKVPTSLCGYVPYMLSLIATVLAMKTKEIAFTIPFTLLLLELSLFGKSFFRWRRLIFLLPFLLTLAIIPLSIYGPEWGLMSPGAEGVAEITRLDKIYDLEKRSRYEYFITQSRVIMTYLRLLLFPWPQRVVYDLAASRSFWSFSVIFSFMGIALLHFFAFASWVGAHCSSGRRSLERRFVAIGILWFFLTISIESSLIPIKDLIFEHRTYLPSVGFLLVVALYLLRFAERFRPAMDIRIKALVMIALLVTLLCSATFFRNKIWTSELSLWQDVVEKAPNKPIGYHNRGLAYSKQGDMEKALKDMDTTIGYFSQDPGIGDRWESADLSRYNMAKAYTNRANIRENVGLLREAAEDRKRSQELFTQSSLPPEPITQDDRLKLANDYANHGDQQKALDELNRLLQAEKDNPAFLINRGNAYSALQRYDEALADLSRVIALRPEAGVAYHNRALVYVGLKRDKEALKDLNKACATGFKPSCEAVEFVRNNGGKFPGN